MKTYIRWLLAHRRLASALLIASMALSLFAARKLQIQFQFRDFYDYPGNAQLPMFKQDTNEFGDPAGNIVVLVSAHDVFAPDVIDYVRKLTEALEPDPTFIRIRSLANARGIYAKSDEVVSGALYRKDAQNDADAETIRKYVSQSPLYVRRLISSDARYTAVLAEMRTPATFATIDEQKHALEVVQHTVDQMKPPPGVKAKVTGAPIIETETTQALLDDQLTLIPGVMAVIILALIWTFRSAHGVLLCLAAVNVAMLWAAGVYATFDRHVDILAAVTPTALLVYGVVDPVFVLTRFLQKLELGRSKEEAIEEAFVELGMPCFLTSLTTAIGFAAFATAIAPTVRFYGITVGLGVLFAWLTTVTVLPLLLAVVSLPKSRFSALTSTKGVDALIEWLWVRVRARPKLFVAAGAALLLGTTAFGSKQHLSNGYISGLPKGEVKTTIREMEDQLSGVIRVIVYLEGAPNTLKKAAVLKAMLGVDSTIGQEPNVTSSISIAEAVADVHQAFSANAPGSRAIPDSDALVSQYLSLIDPEDKRDLVNDDFSKAHIAFLMKDRGSEPARELVEHLRAAVKAAGFEQLGVRATLTGNGVVSFSELDNVVIDILRGFVIAFLVVLLFVAIGFRSLKLALIAAWPNLVPVALCFVALRMVDMALKLDTALVLCVSIGGLFNTTIHIFARLRLALRDDTTAHDDGIRIALLTIGPPSLYTAAILSAGFAVLGLSRFPGFQAMGLLSMLTLLTGFASDMVFTSTLLKLFPMTRKPTGSPEFSSQSPSYAQPAS